MRDLIRPIALLAAGGAVLLVIFAIGLRLFGSWYDTYQYGPLAQCNIDVIPLGELVSYESSDPEGTPDTLTANETAKWIRDAHDSGMEGIMLYIDSGGGLMVPAEEVMNELRRSPLPTVALIGESGLSGAYLAATGADRIIASPYSEVGSIGVTYSYLENASANETSGYDFIGLSSGSFKDAGNPDKAITEEERARFQELANYYGNKFIELVAANRQRPVESIRELADGFAVTSERALEAGLIDEIGDRETARAYFASALEYNTEDIVFCDD